MERLLRADGKQRRFAVAQRTHFSGLATRSRSRQAGYQLDETQRNLDLTRRTVAENTRTLYSAIITDVARVRARLRGIESSQSALDATQTGYEVGTRNIVDVLLAQQRLFAAQFQYASARYQYVRDTLRLKQVVGSLSPEDIYDLDRYIVASESVEKTTPTARQD
ncbi:MAG: TolC family protein [Gammaproteobacteria bacterium]|nr:TolC family protein [Gammaproteobacteria bacterium]